MFMARHLNYLKRYLTFACGKDRWIARADTRRVQTCPLVLFQFFQVLKTLNPFFIIVQTLKEFDLSIKAKNVNSADI